MRPTKFIIEFEKRDGDDYSEVQEAAQLALDAGGLSHFVGNLRNGLFRPARKHGYPDTSGDMSRLQVLVEKANGVVEAIAILERRYTEMLREYNLEKYDL